ncbi:hypothetical protein A0H81_11640 [Grifola frondosa]|uniref:Protein kinase domain-containing protein n=1 Tax=Grifola frondosa TaxID=5627 RepID=A0A1C7LZT9_GRIFR|nr:hypothetical protein A0H81_11640 [Grifola frondosa]
MCYGYEYTHSQARLMFYELVLIKSPHCDDKRAAIDGGTWVFRSSLHFSNTDERPVDVAVKWARGKVAVESLQYEAGMYVDPALTSLQGTVVPKFYGFYFSTDEHVDIACLVLDQISSVGAVAAVRKLHPAGIIHDNLHEDSNFLVGCNGAVRVIDFSRAQKHQCKGVLESSQGKVDLSCKELLDVENRFGLVPTVNMLSRKVMGWSLMVALAMRNSS